MAKTILDAKRQVMQCLGCGEEHPLDDGVNNRPIWFATGVMIGFADHHASCPFNELLICRHGMRADMKTLAQSKRYECNKEETK